MTLRRVFKGDCGVSAAIRVSGMSGALILERRGLDTDTHTHTEGHVKAQGSAVNRQRDV